MGHTLSTPKVDKVFQRAFPLVLRRNKSYDKTGVKQMTYDRFMSKAQTSYQIKGSVQYMIFWQELRNHDAVITIKSVRFYYRCRTRVIANPVEDADKK